MLSLSLSFLHIQHGITHHVANIFNNRDQRDEYSIDKGLSCDLNFHPLPVRYELESLEQGQDYMNSFFDEF